MEWYSFPRDLSQPLPATESDETAKPSNGNKRSGAGDNNGELFADDITNCVCRQSIENKLFDETRPVWKQGLRILQWAGKRSLEIYMIHGLVLNVLRPEVKPIFPSPVGYGYIFGNY